MHNQFEQRLISVYVPISTFGERLALPLSITRIYKMLFSRTRQIGNRHVATDYLRN
jgi:hypothetical protein